MRQVIAGLMACILSTGTAWSAGSKLPDDYKLLLEIQSPQKLLLPTMPKRYVAPVSLSGPIASEMNEALKALELTTPEYREVLEDETFTLIVANKDIPSSTRELLSGILSPVEMIDVILRSFLRYHDKESLAALSKETTLKKKTRDGTLDISLKPRGKRFSYMYEDKGAYIREDWLSAMKLEIDESRMLVRDLTFTKHMRQFTARQQEKPEATVTHHQYVFSYDTVQSVTVPSKLDVYIDSVLTLSISAGYRTEGKYVLFDTRKVTYHTDGQPSSLVMEYGEYQLNRKLAAAEKPRPGKQGKKLAKAALLARKASDALREGRLHTAARILGEITREYPGTPQAVEAQKILKGLHRDF